MKRCTKLELHKRGLLALVPFMTYLASTSAAMGEQEDSNQNAGVEILELEHDLFARRGLSYVSMVDGLQKRQARTLDDERGSKRQRESELGKVTLRHARKARVTFETDRDDLYDRAVNHQTKAQELRQRGISEESVELLDRAAREYGLAARGYDRYLQRYPNDPEVLDIRYTTAETSCFAGRHREAARRFRDLRDESAAGRYLEASSFRYVKSLEALCDAEENAGRLLVPDEPPAAEGEPLHVVPQPLPPIIRELNQARDQYVNLFPGNVRARRFRSSTARALFLFGHWDEARPRLMEIFEIYCSEHEAAFEAWISLVNMAGALEDLDEAERLAQMQTERQCVRPGDDPVGDEMEGSPLPNFNLRHAMARFNDARENGDATLYEESARMFIEAVDRVPDHPEAPAALNNAALAYEGARRFESARAVWSRIVEAYPECEFAEVARFRLAYNSLRVFDDEDAVTHFSILAQSARNPDIRRDSLRNAATILEWSRSYAKSAAFWRRYAQPDVAPNADFRAAAALRAALASHKQQRWQDSIRDMREFITAHRSVAEAGRYRVEAAARLAEAYRKLGKRRDEDRALEGVVREFLVSGEKVGGSSAAIAAEAHFRLVDRKVRAFDGFTIRGGSKSVRKGRESGEARARAIREDLEKVARYRSAPWLATALARTGYTYEILADALSKSRPRRDNNLSEEMEKAAAAWREGAVAEYEKCDRIAREALFVNEHVDHARRRLHELQPETYRLGARGKTVLAFDDIFASGLARIGAR